MYNRTSAGVRSYRAASTSHPQNADPNCSHRRDTAPTRLNGTRDGDSTVRTQAHRYSTDGGL